VIPAALDAPPGRAHEWTVLSGLLHEAAARRGGIAWVEGEAGAGTTALLEAFLAEARRTDCLVFGSTQPGTRAGLPSARAGEDLTLRGDARLGVEAQQGAPRGEARPLGFMLGVLGAGTGPGRAVPRGVEPYLAALRAPGTTAGHLMAMMDTLCAIAPVVLVADNLHEADEASLLLWNRLAKRVDNLSLLLVSGARSGPHRRQQVQLRELLRRRGGQILTMRPLAAPEAGQLAHTLLGTEPGPGLLAYLASAGGNPQRIRDLVTGLREAGLITAAGEIGERDGVARGLLLELVPRPARAVLCQAALLGRDFDPVELGIVAGLGLPELTEALASAVQQGVIVPAAERLAFRHNEIWRACAEEIADPALFHRDAAGALVAAGAVPVAVARHLLAAGDAGPAAIRWLAELPEQAMLADPALFAAVLEPACADSPAATGRLAQLSYWLGDNEKAANLAMSIVDRTGDVTLLRLAVRARLRAGRFLDALDILSRVPTKKLESSAAIAWAGLGDLAKARQLAQTAWADARQSGDPEIAGAALHAMALTGLGSLAASAFAPARQALSDSPVATELNALLLASQLRLSAQQGDSDAVRTALATVPGLAAQADPATAAHLRTVAAEVAYHLTWWTGLGPEQPAPTDPPQTHRTPPGSPQPDRPAGTGTPDVIVHPRSTAPGLGDLIAHRRTRAPLNDRTALDGAVPADKNTGSADSPYGIELAAIQAEAAEDFGTALELRQQLQAIAATIRPTWTDGTIELVRIALAQGETTSAMTAAQWAEQIAGEEKLPLQLAVADCARAMLDQKPYALLTIADRFRMLGFPLCQAMSLEEAAARLGGDGDKRRAGAALREATRLYSSLGAAADLARTEARLRNHGVRRRLAAARPASGWAALTPAERRVAQLVAKGRSNPEIAAELFVSRDTVQTHVSRVLGKLGLKSRLEIIRDHAETA
jgi:DNA-binding CsgD family transcriptional regulator